VIRKVSQKFRNAEGGNDEWDEVNHFKNFKTTGVYIFVISKLRNIAIHRTTVIKFKTLLCSGAIFLHIEISKIVYRIIKPNQISTQRTPFPIDILLLI